MYKLLFLDANTLFHNILFFFFKLYLQIREIILHKWQILTFVSTERDTTKVNDLLRWILLEISWKVCTLNRSNCSAIRSDLSCLQIEWPDAWSSLPLTSFIGSPGLWLPTLSSQAANAISTSLCAPLLSSSLLSPSHMAYGHAPHFSDNFSSERTGHEHQKNVHPPRSHPPTPITTVHGLGNVAVVISWSGFFWADF